MRKMSCQKCSPDRAIAHHKIGPRCYQCPKCDNKVVGDFVTRIDFGQKSIRRISFWLEKYGAPEAHTTSARVMKVLKENEKLKKELLKKEEQSCS
jgi:hypothetical protein